MLDSSRTWLSVPCYLGSSLHGGLYLAPMMLSLVGLLAPIIAAGLTELIFKCSDGHHLHGILSREGYINRRTYIVDRENAICLSF